MQTLCDLFVQFEGCALWEMEKECYLFGWVVLRHLVMRLVVEKVFLANDLEFIQPRSPALANLFG